MMQYKVESIARYNKNAQGEAYPFGVRTVLSLQGVQGPISFFDKGDYASLKEGDSIEGEVVVKGKYKNFEPANSKKGTGSSHGDASNIIVSKLDQIIGILMGDKKPNPKQDPVLEDLPF